MTDELTSPLPGVPADTAGRAIPADDARTGVARSRPRARVRFAVAFLVSLLAGLAVGAGALYAYDREYTGRVLPGVSAGGARNARSALVLDAIDEVVQLVEQRIARLDLERFDAEDLGV